MTPSPDRPRATNGPVTQRIENRDGMTIEWDVAIEMDDGLLLRADVFRPIGDGRYPVIMTHGPYAKGLAWQDGYPTVWAQFSTEHPEAIAGSSNLYQNWETVDPEKWVPDGYACVRVDSRGAGRSPGRLDVWSPRETLDFYACIEWAGTQPWSNGKVGLNGISYFAMNQWQVAALQPPHLAAMCAWEGASDWYREVTHHGGIYTTFTRDWYETQVRSVQHGLGDRGPRSRVTGELVCGPETLDDDELAAAIADFGADALAHPTDDEHWRARTPDYSRISVPFVSAANWGGNGLHGRGNFESYLLAPSKEKWLEAHGLQHWTHFYTPYGQALQKRFFGRFLKGEDTGWDLQPPVLLQVRHVDGSFVERAEAGWPLARTAWTRYYLEPRHLALTDTPPTSVGSVSYAGLGPGVTFVGAPFPHDTELTGPLAARLLVSSETTDADLFLVVRVFTPDLEEVTFLGNIDPHTPIGQGWLRASHRELDPERSLPYRPYHPHTNPQPLVPGEVTELEIEIWPTCVVVPAGYRLGLSVRGTDYVYPGEPVHLSNVKRPLTGCGPYRHDDPTDRPQEVFGGRVTLHVDPAHPSYLLVPVIPTA
jgi:predicted acyl esterase